MNEKLDIERVTITESRPSQVLAALHESAHAEREYLFAFRDAEAGDLILVAWINGTAVGYIAVTDDRADGITVWEHLVAPSHRGEGLGRLLLSEVAWRAVPGAAMVVDPLGDLDLDRVADYYRQLGFEHDASSGRIWASALDVRIATELAGTHRAGESSTSVVTLLERKAPGVVTLPPTSTVHEAIGALNEHHVGAIVVSTNGSRVEGIVSERDVLLALGTRGADALTAQIAELTTTDVITCTTHDSIEHAMQLMTDNRVRHIPVTNTGRLVGLVSIGDIVALRLARLARSEARGA